MRKQPTDSPSGSAWPTSDMVRPDLQSKAAPVCVILDLDTPRTHVLSRASQNKPHKQNSQDRTKGKDFPEQNAIGPDVTQCGAEVVEDALGCHPLHRQESLWGRRKEVNTQAVLWCLQK